MLSIDQLNNAAKDLSHIDDFANSENKTATDRNGRVKTTLSGLINSINMLFTWRYYGSLSADPLSRPDGSICKNGDEYNNSISGARKVFNNGIWSQVAGASSVDFSNSSDASKGSNLIGHDNSNVGLRLNRMSKIDGEYNVRDFFSALSSFNSNYEGNITIACYGDSVSADVQMAFCDFFARKIGFMNQSSFCPIELSTNLITPDGVEPSARWGGCLLAYAIEGGAVYNRLNDGSIETPKYLPNGDQHWSIPTGGAVVWGSGTGTGIKNVTVYFAKQLNGGDCVVSLLNGITNEELQSKTISLNGNLDGVKVEFLNVDTSLFYKVKAVSISGTNIALGAVMRYNRGVTPLSWRWGGSNFIQQNKSPSILFNYINNDLNTSLFFIETKGETSTDGVVDGVDGLSLAISRLNLISKSSKVLIGSRPDGGTKAAQYDQIYRYRSIADANNYVFIDAYNALIDAAEVDRLRWNRRSGSYDVVHLAIISGYFIAGLLLARFPAGFINGYFETNTIFNKKTSSKSFCVIARNNENDESKSVEFVSEFGLNVQLAKLKNIGSLDIKNPYTADKCNMSMVFDKLKFSSSVVVNSIDVASAIVDNRAFAGAGYDLPLKPHGYMRMMVNGELKLIPLFNP